MPTFTPPGHGTVQRCRLRYATSRSFLNATSVGFVPLKYAFTDDPQRRYGVDFLEQELLEFSVCQPIPANSGGSRSRVARLESTSRRSSTGPRSRSSAAARPRASSRLAEDVLGSTGQDPVALTWAERIVAPARPSSPSERIERNRKRAAAGPAPKRPNANRRNRRPGCEFTHAEIGLSADPSPVSQPGGCVAAWCVAPTFPLRNHHGKACRDSSRLALRRRSASFECARRQDERRRATSRMPRPTRPPTMP
jgi:hypothetical protein